MRLHGSIHTKAAASARFFLILIVIIWAGIYVPITFIGLQITYWGWKEAEYKKDKREDDKEEKKEKKKKKEEQQQQMMQMQ